MSQKSSLTQSDHSVRQALTAYSRLRLVGAAMVPAPIERSELPGHRQQIRKSAALSVDSVSVNTSRCPHARARGTAPIPTSSDADRPAPAGWAALRLLADVDISF